MTRPVILVTGASAGIGAAVARGAARDGYDVAINYRKDLAGAQDVANDVMAAGSKAAVIQGDISNPEDVTRIFAEADAALGSLDALINNAGIVDLAARVEDMSVARLRRMFEVNILGSFLCAQQAIRRMSTGLGGKGGSIVNLSSAAARLGSPNQYVDYAASKGAIDSFTRGLALEQAAQGIRVNAVSPGIIATDIHAKSGTPDRVAKLSAGLPMQRAGTADEVANAILWLISAKASYVTGAIYDVSGGR